MKKDHKVFVIYILILLIYGGSYWLSTKGKFAFSPEYSDFGLGIISFGLFFHKKITRYSFLLITLGFSLLYVIADHPTFSLINTSNFHFIRNATLLLIALSLSVDLIQKKINSFVWILSLLILLILGYFGLRIAGMEEAFSKEFTFYKNLLGFVLISILLGLDRNKQRLAVMIRRILIVVGLSFFIGIMTYMTR